MRRSNHHRLAAAALAGVAVGVHATTRTGCRACDPDGLLQGHGAWHVLSAVAVTLLATGEEPH